MCIEARCTILNRFLREISTKQCSSKNLTKLATAIYEKNEGQINLQEFLRIVWNKNYVNFKKLRCDSRSSSSCSTFKWIFFSSLSWWIIWNFWTFLGILWVIWTIRMIIVRFLMEIIIICISLGKILLFGNLWNISTSSTWSRLNYCLLYTSPSPRD